MKTIDIPRPPENASVEQWQAWWENMVEQMEITIAMLEKVEIDRHKIPLDS
jgi:hypothetical protein